MRVGNKPRAQETSGTSAANGRTQWTSQRSHRRNRKSERGWPRHQYRAAGHGLRRRRTHFLSKRAAGDLQEYPHWQPHLHELGECEVKHGVRVSVVNLYTAELGNPAVPEKLKAARVAAAAVPEKSIAVLPFENRSRDPDNAYFADGIQDEILTRLSKIADLKVISRTSTQHYKSAPENLPEIARQLGVAHILEGRVQKRGDAVRVNVQLIKT